MHLIEIVACQQKKWIHSYWYSKGGFISESAIHFQISKSPKKKIFQKTILNLKFKFPAKNTFLEIWRFQNESYFHKKSHL